MELFGSSGTRGIVNERLTPGFVLGVAAAAGTAWQADRVAVGRDTRRTGRMLENAAASGLASVGSDVDRVGVVPTPAIQAYAAANELPAVVLTASHNPPEYNGIKLVDDDGVELAVGELERIEKLVESGDHPGVSWDRTGRERVVGGVDSAYIDGIVGAVDGKRIADADLRVALDPGHGAASETSPTLLRRLGCEVHTVNAQPDGRFPGRAPEPTETSLTALQRLTRACDADVGIAHDGDGDRAIFVDERGEYVEGDASFAALASAELAEGDVTVSAVTVSQRLVDVVSTADASLELTPVGSTYIATEIRALRAAGHRVPIAGEGNGGIYFPPFAVRRDGAYTAARFLELLATRDDPVSEVITPFEDYVNVRHNVRFADVDDRAAMRMAVEAAAETLADEENGTRSTIDGVRVDVGDGWVLARPSGTEPLYRVYAEARAADRASALADRLRDALVEARSEVA